jgi:ATP-dependent Lhr-like helicase
MEHPFSLLARPIQRLLEERGFLEPTLPQREAIPKILEGKNVLLIAPTGTGKTEAAFLPALHNLLVSGERVPGIKLFYITPLRALNRDMLDRMQWWCRSLDFKISVRHGDTEARERRAQAIVPPDIVVTTPESLQLFLLGRKLRQYLKVLRCVIVDEVHELADNKRGVQLSVTLERLREASGRDFQLIGLSATIGSPQEVARFLVGTERPCEIVDVSVARKMEISVIHPVPGRGDERLAQKLFTFPEVAARIREMKNLILSHRSTLIFTNTRPMAEVLGSRFYLWDVKFPISVHHGSLSAATRVGAERRLKQGELKGIICTSSMELGIDIGHVDLVIQYNSPRQATRLIQRVGRSGHRIGETAKGVVIVQDPDDALESIVIAKRALSQELEDVDIPEKPLDVLLHSICSMLVERREVEIERALEVIRRAHPFRDLSIEDVMRVLEFAEGLEGRFLKISDDRRRVLRTGRTRLFDYYFSNLSMIPEFKQYLVVDDETGQPVGVLDEEFVAEYGEPEVRFVMGGEVWKILQVYRGKIYVRKEKDPLGAIPTWIGEEIPVPLEVAREVGRMRREVAEMLSQGMKFEEVCGRLAGELGVERRTLEAGLENVKRQVEAGFPVPSDRTVTVESVGDTCVVNVCGGTLVNRTIARLLAHRLSGQLGISVGFSVDPYRIVFRSDLVRSRDVAETLRGGADIESGLREMVEESRFFRWRLAQVARRMGVLSREVELTSTVLDRLVKAMHGTPAFDEAFRETSVKDFDVERTKAVLGEMREGRMEVFDLGNLKKPSPISETVWRRTRLLLEPAAPKRLKMLAMASAKARLLAEVRVLVCTECGFVKEVRVYEVDDPLRCPTCGSGRIGICEEGEEEARRAFELHMQGRDTRLWRLIEKTAGLVSSYGRMAVIVLAGRGISPSAAKEILEKARDERRLVELIVAKEREAAMRRFAP